MEVLTVAETDRTCRSWDLAKVILGVTISLDGFAEDAGGSVGALYPDLEILHGTQVLKESIRTTGAVVMAWKEYAMAEDPDWFAGNYEYQVPIFVVADKVPAKQPKETERISFSFITDGLASAVREAKGAAAGKDVTVIGSSATTAQCLREGLADELQVDILPFFLRQGFRPFEDLGVKPVQLERTKVVELPGGRIHVRFRIIR